MKSTKMTAAFLWKFRFLIAGVILMLLVMEIFIQSLDQSNQYEIKSIRFFPALEVIYIWTLALLNQDVWKRVLINDADIESTRKTRNLAKSSLVLGNISLGTVCLFILVITLRVVSATIQAEVRGGHLSSKFEMIILIGYVLAALCVFIFGLASLIATGIALIKIKREGGDGDNGIKTIGKRGALLGLLGIILHVIVAGTAFLRY